MTASTEIGTPILAPATRGRSLWQKLARRPTAVLSLVILLFFVICAIWPWAWMPYDPTSGIQTNRFVPPVFAGGTSAHLLGTDALGRDVLSMVLAGSRATLLIVVGATLIGVVVGTIAGLTAGYFGGWVDSLIMRLADIQLAFPAIVLIIAIVAAFGPKMINLVIILGIVRWASYARIARGAALSLRNLEYIEAVRVSGMRSPAILRRHILPNSVTSIIMYLSSDMARLTILEASLSFLGLGVQPPNPSWGLLISQGKQYIYEAWWVALAPGIAIVLLVLALNFLGDELRDALDPTSR